MSPVWHWLGNVQARVNLRLPDPMLSKPGSLPLGPSYAFEVKFDGFRAIVDTHDGLRVRSRRGWNMTGLLPELAELPAGLTLDGELVAFADGSPHFPLVCDRMLRGRAKVRLTFMVFDLLARDGESL